VNKLEFVKKITEHSLNRLSGSVISSSSTRVRKKLNEPSLNIQYSARLGSITALKVSPNCELGSAIGLAEADPNLQLD
jgi:hypothetical protein